MKIEEAYKNDMENADEIIVEQAKEIERLQDMDKILRNENINLKLRINKAIEWVEKNKCQFHNDDNELVKSEISFIVNARPYEILYILRGDKE